MGLTLIRKDPTCLQSNHAQVPQPLSLRSRAQELQPPKRARPGACVPKQEKPPQREAHTQQRRAAPLTTTRERLCAAWRPSTAKNETTKKNRDEKVWGGDLLRFSFYLEMTFSFTTENIRKETVPLEFGKYLFSRHKANGNELLQ